MRRIRTQTDLSGNQALGYHDPAMRALIALLLTLLGCTAPSLHPDAVFHNASVVTLDDAAPSAQAVAVLHGRIVAVGADSDLLALAGPDTERIDLAGATLLPGFYAAHDHFPMAGRLAKLQVDLNSPPIGRVENIEQIVEALKQRAAETPAGEWIVGRGYDDTLLAEKRHPTRDDLDRVSTEHPIWLIHTSGHLGVANSRALALAGVTRRTPQPKGGVIRIDEKTGEPDGVFEEAGGLVSRHIPPATLDQRMEAVEWAVEHYLSQGVTTAVIASGDRERFGDLQEARRRGLLKFRLVTMLSKSAAGRDSLAEAGEIVSGFGDNWLRLGAIKSWQDGSNQGFTGYFTQPYHTPFKGDASYRGYASRTREELAALVKELHDAGYQIAVHGNGDAAIDDILHAYEQAQAANPRPDARHRIEHCQYVREDQLDKIAELGVTPSFFVGHVYYWGDRHREIFLGPERAAHISPLASAARRGIRFTVHDDTPVTPVDPLQLVWVSVNRTTKSGHVLGDDQRVDVLSALRAITLDAAWQNHEEDRKGSIEAGKLADFTVLARNPLEVEPDAIRDIAIVRTVVAGKTVWQAR